MAADHPTHAFRIPSRLQHSLNEVVPYRVSAPCGEAPSWPKKGPTAFRYVKDFESFWPLSRLLCPPLTPPSKNEILVGCMSCSFCSSAFLSPASRPAHPTGPAVRRPTNHPFNPLFWQRKIQADEVYSSSIYTPCRRNYPTKYIVQPCAGGIEEPELIAKQTDTSLTMNELSAPFFVGCMRCLWMMIVCCSEAVE